MLCDLITGSLNLWAAFSRLHSCSRRDNVLPQVIIALASQGAFELCFRGGLMINEADEADEGRGQR